MKLNSCPRTRTFARVDALEQMAIKYLVSNGFNAEHAKKRVLSRTRREDIHRLVNVVAYLAD